MAPKIRSLIAGLCLLAALVLLASCGAPRPSGPSGVAGPPVEQQLEALWQLGQERLAKGQNAAAADAYRAALGLAKTNDDRARSRLGLARSLEAAGQPREAVAQLEAMPKLGVNGNLVIDGNVLAARLELETGQADRAADRLEGLTLRPPRPLTEVEERQVLDLLARAQAASGRAGRAVATLIKLSALPPGADAAFLRRLAQTAGLASPAEVEAQRDRPLPPAINAALSLGLAQSLIRAGRLDEAQTMLIDLAGAPAARELSPEVAAMERELAQARQVSPHAVGAVLPLTGPFAPYGRRVLAAVELGLGLFDPTVQSPPTLYIEDSQGDPRRAAEAVQKLVTQRKVMAIIGPMSSAAGVAAARQAQQLEVPLIALSQVEGITRAGDYVFQNVFTPDEQVNSLLDEVMGLRGKTSFAVLAPDNEYGHGFSRLMTRRVTDRGGRMVRRVFYKTDQTDFTPWVKELVKLPPGNYRPGLPDSPEAVIDFEVLFIPDSPARVAMLAAQLTYYDVLGEQIMGTSLWHDRELVDQAARYLVDALFPDAFNPVSPRPLVERFVRDYRAAIGTPPNLLDAQGCDAALLVRQVLASPRPPHTRPAFREALAALSGVEGVCGVLSVSPQRLVTKPTTLFIITTRGIRPLTEADRERALRPPEPDEKTMPLPGQGGGPASSTAEPGAGASTGNEAASSPAEPAPEPVRTLDLPLRPAPAGTIPR